MRRTSTALTRVWLQCWKICFVAMFATLIVANQASAISVRHDRAVALYNNLGAQFPATGYFGTVGAGQFCTGTLVAPNKVLIAAHCVDFNANGILDDPVGTMVFGLEANVPGGLANNVQSVAINPKWVTSGGSAQFDMAVVTLNIPFGGPVATLSKSNPQGLRGFAVGYGAQGNGLNHPSALAGANDKLGAENIIDFVGNTIRFDFDSPNANTNSFGNANPLNLEGATAGGDSGSPLYAQFAFGNYVVGVLNGGFNPFGVASEYGDISIYARVGDPMNLMFLESQGLTVVPEPATGVVCIIGLGLMLRRRRK